MGQDRSKRRIGAGDRRFSLKKGEKEVSLGITDMSRMKPT
jgi:hypothetical protein